MRHQQSLPLTLNLSASTVAGANDKLVRLGATLSLSVSLLVMPVRAQSPAHSASARTVVINGALLSEPEVQALEILLRAPVRAGKFWYDRVSGGWGLEGGPLVGFIPPGIAVGGPLRADASHGTTHVFINGRELHIRDVVGLARWTGTQVIPGRYWVDARGNFGYEGGPMLGNLVQIAQQNNPQLRRQGSTVTSCAAYACSSSNTNTGLGVITDGEGHGAVFSDGKVISTP